MTHDLKTWPEYYAPIRSGKKPFELRFNDRNYQIGDVLHLHEYDMDKGYSGNSCQFEVTYILDASKFVGLDGYVIMGLARDPIATIDVTVEHHPKMEIL